MTDLSPTDQAIALAVALIGGALRGDPKGMVLTMDGTPELAEHVAGALAQIAADALTDIYGRDRVDTAVSAWQPGNNLFALLDDLAAGGDL